jgi:hypothetical protein
MSYARRRNRKLKRDLVSKPKLVEKVVKEHNKKAKANAHIINISISISKIKQKWKQSRIKNQCTGQHFNQPNQTHTRTIQKNKIHT